MRRQASIAPRAIDDVEAAYIDDQPTTPDKAFDALELRRYDYHRRRFGYSGETPIDAADSSSSKAPSPSSL